MSSSSSNNNNSVLIDSFFSQICRTRNTNRINTVPPTRYNNLDSSPYLLGFTKDQLDMRRKAEILTYNTNKKTNGLSKNQKFSSIMNKSTNPIFSNTNQCFTYKDTGGLISTSSSSCDVPGPIINLFNDKNIPLYNYTKGDVVPSITLEYNSDVLEEN